MSAIVIDLLAEWVLCIEDEHGVSHDQSSYENLGIAPYLERAGVTWRQVDKRANDLHDERMYDAGTRRADLPHHRHRPFGTPTYAAIGLHGAWASVGGEPLRHLPQWEPASGATGGIYFGDECPPGYVKREFTL